MLSYKRTFAFIIILFIAFAIDCICDEIDSYTVGIYRNRNEHWQKKSKWSKNDVNGDLCGGIFREKQVLIQSPNFPNLYPKNANCEYVFYSPFVCANEFHIQFLDFQLEPSLNCSKDKIKIGRDEVLCGQVIGIMKYKTFNGALRIQFTSDPTIENKGFELLVTRLPCEMDQSTIEKSIKSSTNLPVTISLTVDSNNWTPKQNRIEPIETQTESIASNHSLENLSETSYIKPVCIKKGQSQLNRIWPNTFPPAKISPSFVSAPPTLPSCCINIYNQQTFYLISPNFPNLSRFRNDCLFYLERTHSNVCRLRIEFKYFLLGDWQQPQPNQCTHSYVEIDGSRFCGCKTGTIYRTQWGTSPKSIRFTNLQQYPGVQGFILEITQEPCPYRVTLTNQHLARSNQLLSTQNYLTQVNDPRRCSPKYISWLNFNTNHALLAKSICVRNFG